MSVVSTRRAHLEEAIQEFGGVAQLAKRLGLHPSTVSGLRNGHRNVGHQTARSVEEVMGWPEGYMDIPPMAVASELAHLLDTMPEDQIIEALKGVVGDLSDEGAAAIASAILARVASKL